MRAGSVAKTLIGWFLLPVVMGGVAFYVMKPMFEGDADPQAASDVQSDGTKVASKKFAAPSVKIFSTKSRGMRRGGDLIGKRGHKKKKVEEPKAADTGGPPGPPITSSSGGGTPPDTGGTASPGTGGTTPVSGGTF
jgi:hypothetical protein